jgi:integrase
MKGTRFPGVKALGDRKYLLRFKATNRKTGKVSEHKIETKDCPSAAEAAKRRAALIVEHEGSAAPTDRVRLSTYLHSWLKNKKPELAPGTFERYVRTLQLHVLCRDAQGVELAGFPLGDYFLDALTHEDVIEWRDAQQGEPSTVNSRLRVLKTALSDAVATRHVQHDPSSHVSALPEDGYTDEEPNSLTPEQLGTLLEAVRVHAPQWYALFAVLAFTGARVGEATALKWDDLQTGEGDGGVIVIRRSHNRGRIRTTTKTSKWRRCPMPKELAAILSDHRRTLVAQQHPGLEHGWLFSSSRGRRAGEPGGKPTYPSVVRNALLAMLVKLERAAAEQAAREGRPAPGPALPHFTVHGLRRTMNNLLRQTTNDKTVVRAVVGHVTERMTELYSHVADVEKGRAVGNVVALVRGRKSVEVEAQVEVRGHQRESGA